jgi:hypothetical protein
MATSLLQRPHPLPQPLPRLRGRGVKPLHLSSYLCGYFGSDYLGYEAAEGIDWVWEHRIDDLQKLGL